MTIHAYDGRTQLETLEFLFLHTNIKPDQLSTKGLVYDDERGEIQGWLFTGKRVNDSRQAYPFYASVSVAPPWVPVSK